MKKQDLYTSFHAPSVCSVIGDNRPRFSSALFVRAVRLDCSASIIIQYHPQVHSFEPPHSKPHTVWFIDLILLWSESRTHRIRNATDLLRTLRTLRTHILIRSQISSFSSFRNSLLHLIACQSWAPIIFMFSNPSDVSKLTSANLPALVLTPIKTQRCHVYLIHLILLIKIIWTNWSWNSSNRFGFPEGDFIRGF